MSIDKIKDIDTDSTISPTAKKLIAEVLKETNEYNIYKLCYKVAEKLDERYESNDKLCAFQSKRMNLDTTGKIMKALDIYLYKYAKDIEQTK